MYSDEDEKHTYVISDFVTQDNTVIVDITEYNDNEMGLDIGPHSIELFKNELSSSKTIFWNGTLGYSEYKNYADGTREIL